MSLRSALVRQFHRPEGLLGRIAGWIMSTRGSNLERNRWSVDLLDVEPGHRVLELGPGPGVTLGLLLDRAAPGSVTAIDHSPLMLQACARRHRGAVRQGRLQLIEAAFPGIPEGEMFDRILAVNSLQFDAQSVSTFREFGSHLVSGGKLAVTCQPRGAKADEAAADAWAKKVSSLIREGGLAVTGVEKLPLEPVPAVCILASKGPAVSKRH